MELIKRKVLLESMTSRNPDTTYGTITATTIYLKVFLTQNIEDLGLFTDMPYDDQDWAVPPSIGSTPNTNNILVNDLLSRGLLFPFMTGQTYSEVLPTNTDDLRPIGRDSSYYYNYGYRMIAFTDSKVSQYQTYFSVSPYRQNVDIIKKEYVDYLGQTIQGRDRITAPTGMIDPNSMVVTYVNSADVGDPNIGNKLLQQNGFIYTTYTLTGDTAISGATNFGYDILNLANIINPDYPERMNTTISYIGEGWNHQNTELSAITREEIYLGIVSPPEVQTDVFIDRGVMNPIERHLRLSEVEGVDHLMKYGGGSTELGNGYYNIIKNNL